MTTEESCTTRSQNFVSVKANRDFADGRMSKTRFEKKVCLSRVTDPKSVVPPAGLQRQYRPVDGATCRPCDDRHVLTPEPRWRFNKALYLLFPNVPKRVVSKATGQFVNDLVIIEFPKVFESSIIHEMAMKIKADLW